MIQFPRLMRVRAPPIEEPNRFQGETTEAQVAGVSHQKIDLPVATLLLRASGNRVPVNADALCSRREEIPIVQIVEPQF